ncbi:MAG: GDSL family lipase [Lacunisphaera sp.]
MSGSKLNLVRVWGGIALQRDRINTDAGRGRPTILRRSFVGLICVFIAARSYAAGEAAAKTAPTLYVVADSTAASNAEFTGWGDAIKPYFDSTKLTIVNCSMGGTSSHTYFLRADWENLICAKIRPGDFVLIQFSLAEKNPIAAARVPGSLPGIGTESSDAVLPDGKVDHVQTYGSYIRKFVADARRKGATPILITSTPPNAWHAGNFRAAEAAPDAWLRQVGREESVVVLDLFVALSDEYQRLGPGIVRTFFPRDHIHTNRKGADVTASLIVALLANDPENELNNFLSKEGNAVVPDLKRPKVKFKLARILTDTPPN